MIRLVSFSYRDGGIPLARAVIDCRKLANPHRVAGLRPLTGLERAVQDYVFADPEAGQLLNRLRRQVTVGQIEPDATIAFGCVGGRHRSVAMAERFAGGMRHAGFPVVVEHLALAAPEQKMDH